jgi:hypothetical protein
MNLVLADHRSASTAGPADRRSPEPSVRQHDGAGHLAEARTVWCPRAESRARQVPRGASEEVGCDSTRTQSRRAHRQWGNGRRNHQPSPADSSASTTVEPPVPGRRASADGRHRGTTRGRLSTTGRGRSRARPRFCARPAACGWRRVRAARVRPGPSSQPTVRGSADAHRAV